MRRKGAPKPQWVAVKNVSTTGSTICGCIVGPFTNEHIAGAYCEEAVKGSLGYEKWFVRELLYPAELVTAKSR
jgi:hypothetical protein